MRESSYGGTLRQKIQEEIGGKVIKIADKVTLGLPDYMHIQDGIVTFIECKMGERFEVSKSGWITKPWDVVNDLRQFEVLRQLSKYALVLYVAYYAEVQSHWMMTVAQLRVFKTGGNCILKKGHGTDTLRHYLNVNEEKICDRL
jgi:hypothetical protein